MTCSSPAPYVKFDMGMLFVSYDRKPTVCCAESRLHVLRSCERTETVCRGGQGRCGRDAQFIGLCSSLKWSRHRTKSPFLALPATAGSNAADKIISACSNAVS